jgi:hypothetical protein
MEDFKNCIYTATGELVCKNKKTVVVEPFVDVNDCCQSKKHPLLQPCIECIKVSGSNYIDAAYVFDRW